MSLLLAVHAETMKALSLKPLRRAAALTVGCTAVISYAVSATSTGLPTPDRLWPVPTALQWGQVGVVALGALVSGSEHVGGQARTTLLAQPRRLTAAVAKVVTTTGVTAAVTALTLAASVTSGWAATTRAGAAVPLATVQSAASGQRLAGAAAYLLLVALLGLAAAGLARGFVAGAGMVSVLLLIPPALEPLGGWTAWLPPGDGVGQVGVELALWPVVALPLWAWALHRRDA